MNSNKEILIETIPEFKELEIEVIEEIKEQEIEIQQENIVVEVLNADKYKGEYVISPKAYQEQELDTKNKLLEKNLIVKEVPFFEVSNLEGTTVYIGSEV